MDFEVNRSKGVKAIFAYFFISLFGALLVSVIVGLLGIKNMAVASSLVNLLTYLLLTGLLILIYKKDLLVEFNVMKKTNKLALKILGALGIYYVISIFTNTFVSNIEIYSNFANSVLGKHNTITSVAENQTSIEAMLNGGGFIFMFLAAGFFGPLCEELVFRKAFFSLFKQKELGIMVSSLSFGLIHILSSLGSYNFTSMILMTIPGPDLWQV